jgi:membrane fusion protein (multidrug efflux system)
MSSTRSRSARGFGACGVCLFSCTAAIIVAAISPIYAQQQATAPVGTVYAERASIADTLGFVGRVEAIDRVEIKARVKGYLEAVLFKEGDFVTQGTPLYEIEREPFQAAVEQAQAALVRSKGAKLLTEVQLARAETLLSREAGSAVTRDQARAADEQARGAILADDASLKSANINLGYTDIESPISGKISRTNVTAGNVVGPESGSLTLIVSQDPMYVTFPVSQRDLLQAQLGGRKDKIKDVKIKIRFADGSSYNQEGSINFIDVSVNRSTDTVIARATMPNPDGILTDGQLVNVTVEAGQPEERVTVPQAALIADQAGVYVFAVEDGKAVIKRVKPGSERGTNVVVEGLEGGEQIIVEGLQSVRPGQPVQASPVTTTLNPS